MPIPYNHWYRMSTFGIAELVAICSEPNPPGTRGGKTRSWLSANKTTIRPPRRGYPRSDSLTWEEWLSKGGRA